MQQWEVWQRRLEWDPQVGGSTTVCSLELQLSLHFGGEFLVVAGFSAGGSGVGFVLYSERDPVEVVVLLEMA